MFYLRNNAYNVIDFCTAEKNKRVFKLSSKTGDPFLSRNVINLLITSVVERVFCFTDKTLLKSLIYRTSLTTWIAFVNFH